MHLHFGLTMLIGQKVLSSEHVRGPRNKRENLRPSQNTLFVQNAAVVMTAQPLVSTVCKRSEQELKESTTKLTISSNSRIFTI